MTGTLMIDPEGVARFVWNDELQPVAKELGAYQIRRASHVEPTADGDWTADMSPVGGPVLGPFPLRAVALEAEVNWLYDWMARERCHGG